MAIQRARRQNTVAVSSLAQNPSGEAAAVADTRLRKALEARDTLHIEPRPPSRMTVLTGKRLEAAVREPFASLWTNARSGRSVGDLVAARAEALFRVPQTRSVSDYIDVLTIQLRELAQLPQDSASRLMTAAPAIDIRSAAVLRGLTARTTHVTDRLVADACLLSQTASQFPELAKIAEQARESALRLATLPRVAAISRPAQSRPGSRIQTAVVAGAGPAGLAAAIELLTRGVAVDLVDARDPWEYTRPVQMVVKMRALDQLAHLGVLERLRPHLSRIRADVEKGPGFSRSVPLEKAREPDGHRVTRSGGDFAESSSVYIISMHELERALFERALELGVRTISHASIDISAPTDTTLNRRHGVVAHRGQVNGRNFTANGEHVSLGFPDLIVIAEGSRNARREQFEIDWMRDDRPLKRGLAGLVAVDIGPESHTWSECESAEVEPVISVGHATSGATWTLVEVPENERIKTFNDAERVFLQRSGRALGRKLTTKDLLFGGKTLFPIENRIAKSAVFFAGERQAVIAVGDAKGVGSPKVGLGMQYGIGVDALNIGRFVDHVDAMGFARAGAIVDASIRDSVRIWHRRFV